MINKINKLVASNISKSYSTKQIVKNVSIEVKSGEIVGLLGPNGAGKTTSFHIITGLIKPSSGDIHLNDHNITKLPIYKRARLGVGYLPQESSIFKGLNVEENILAILEIFYKNSKERLEKLDKLVSEFSISHLRKTKADALSGGERRRVEIARTIAINPKFILLDEPLAGIDPIAISDLKKLIMHLKNLDIGILITDHNVKEIISIVDKLYIIYSGEVMVSGRPEEIIKDQNVRNIYLGQDWN